MKPLPSMQAAQNLFDGKPGALGEVLFTITARALLISTGIYLSGVEKDTKKLLISGFAGALAIESYVIHHTFRYNHEIEETEKTE